VIAAALWIEARRSAEFPHDNDQGFIKQATLQFWLFNRAREGTKLDSHA
jgi:hypothetical protein